MVNELKSRIKSFFGNNESMGEEALQKLGEDVSIGSLFEDVMRNSYPLIEQHILSPMKEDAFKTFQKVDPADELAVIETQMIPKVIDEIKKRIKSKIEQGRSAQETIRSTLAQEEEL